MGGHDPFEHIRKQIPKVPDYRIYKVEDCPKLLKVQQRLAAKGLRDPWLRNEVWRFKEATPLWTGIRVGIFRGFTVGLAALGVTILFEQLFKLGGGGHDDHGHH